MGKTSILSSFCSVGNIFPKDYVAVYILIKTSFSDIFSKIITVNDSRDVELYFFDIAG